MVYFEDRLNFENHTSYRNEWEALNEAETYLNREDKSKLVIYYDPSNSELSCISRGNTKDEYFLMVCGIIFLIIGLFANRKEMIGIIKRSREKAKSR